LAALFAAVICSSQTVVNELSACPTNTSAYPQADLGEWWVLGADPCGDQQQRGVTQRQIKCVLLTCRLNSAFPTDQAMSRSLMHYHPDAEPFATPNCATPRTCNTNHNRHRIHRHSSEQQHSQIGQRHKSSAKLLSSCQYGAASVQSPMIPNHPADGLPRAAAAAESTSNYPCCSSLLY
jgi:hypothetical protein